MVKNLLSGRNNVNIASFFLVTMIVILAVLAVAGCTGGSPTATPAPGAGTVTPAPTSSPAGTTGPLGSLADFSKARWYEYAITEYTSEGTNNITYKVVRAAPYAGVSDAEHLTLHSEYDGFSIDRVTDIDAYTGPDNGRLLGGHFHMVTKDANQENPLIMDEGLAPGSDGSVLTDGYRLDAPYVEFSLPAGTMEPEGDEAVSVPAGNFLAHKYAITGGGELLKEFWFGPGVPVGLKMVSYGGGSPERVMELMGWG